MYNQTAAASKIINLETILKYLFEYGNSDGANCL